MGTLWSDPSLEDRALNEKFLVFELNNDTSDCPETYALDIDDEVVIMRTEDNVATANAVESIACCSNPFTAPDDSDGIIGFLLQKSKFEPHLTIDKVLGVEVLYVSSGTTAVTLHGTNRTTNDVAFASGVTGDGNIAFSIDSSIDLAANDLRMVVKVNYRTRH